MKTLNTISNMIAMSIVLTITTNVTVYAASKMSTSNPSYTNTSTIVSLEGEAELADFEEELKEQGVLQCENAEIIVVLGKDDQIVYQGSHQLEDENNAFLTRILTKADLIMSSGGKNFYKIF